MLTLNNNKIINNTCYDFMHYRSTCAVLPLACTGHVNLCTSVNIHARLSNQMKKYRKLHSRANAILRLDFHASAGNWVLDIAMSARWISMQGKETNYKPEDFFAMLFLSNLLQTLKLLIIIQKEKFKFIYILIFFFFTWFYSEE